MKTTTIISKCTNQETGWSSKKESIKIAIYWTYKSQKIELQDKDGLSIRTHGNYNGGKQLYRYQVKTNNVPEYKPIFTIREEDKFLPKFSNHPHGGAFGFDDSKYDPPTVDMFLDLILPDKFIDKTVHCSNGYAKWRHHKQDPYLKEDSVYVLDNDGQKKKNPLHPPHYSEIHKSGKKMYMYFFTAALDSNFSHAFTM